MCRYTMARPPGFATMGRLVAVVLLALALASPAAFGAKDDQIADLLRLSGIERQVAEMPALMQQQMNQQKQKVPPEVQEAMVKALVEAYAPSALLETVRRHAAKNYDEAKITATLTWLNGPLGTRMTQLEIASSTVQGQNAKIAYAQSLQGNPPPKERIELMVRLNEATHATESSIQIVVASFDGMMRGMMATLPEEQRLTEQQLAEIENKMVQQLVRPLMNQSLVGFLYTYREISDPETEQAIAFYQSDAGSWYAELISDALLTGMAEGGERFGQQMDAVVKKTPRRS
jgi:hypothetical protein